MKPRAIVMLLTLLVICAGFLVINRIGCDSDAVTEQDRRIFANLDGDIRTIRIQPATGDAVALRLADGQARLTAPVDAPAEPDTLEQLTATLHELSYTRMFSPGDDEALSDTQTGLDTPRLTVTFTTADGTEHTLLIGRQAPQLGTGVAETYVRPGDSDQTFVVARDLAAAFPADVEKYRDMTMLDVPKDRIFRVRVEGRDAYTLEGGADNWTLIEPTAAKVKQLRVDTLLRKLSNLQAAHILSENADDLRPYGLDKPQLAITVYLLPPTPTTAADTQPAITDARPPVTHTLLLGNTRQDQVCAKLADQPVVFTLPKQMAEDLDPRLEDIRSMTLLDVTAGEVEAITITRAAGEPIELVRKGGEWTFASPFDAQADAGRVRSLLDNLLKLKAANWIAGSKPLDIPAPTAAFTLQLTGEKPRQATLTVGGKTPDGVHYVAQSSQANSPATVAVGDVLPLLNGLEHYWPRELTSVGEGERIVELSLRRSDGTVDLVRLAGGYWRQTSPAEADADAQRIENVLGSLQSIVADEVVHVGRQLPAKFADAARTVRAIMTVKPASDEDAAPRTVTVFAGQVDGKTFAWMQRDGLWVVGHCEDAIYDALTADMQTPPADEDSAPMP